MMKLNRLALALSRGTWLMEQRLVDRFYPLAERFLAGEDVKWFDESDKKLDVILEIIAADDRSVQQKRLEANNDAANFFAGAPAGSIATIPIQGPIMKYDSCGDPGTDTLSSWITAAAAAPNIIGILMHVNSGGGTVQGTAEFAAVVAQAAKQKPVETFTDGLLASAAYWPSASTRITASSKTVEVGSIGTAFDMTDDSKRSASAGVERHYVTADASFDKNEDYQQVRKGNYGPLKANILNPTNDVFLTGVKEARADQLQLSDVSDADGNLIGQYPLTGQLYLAEKAKDLGLINAIGTKDSVIQSIIDRAGSDEFPALNNNPNMSLFGNNKTSLKSLAALKGKKAAEITDQEIVAVNEELEAAGFDNVAIISSAHVEEAHAHADAVSAGLTAINKALALEGDKAHKTLDAAIGAMVAAHKAEHDRAETYGKQPGAKPTNPATPKNSEGGNPKEQGKKKNFETSYDQDLAAQQELNRQMAESGLNNI